MKVLPKELAVKISRRIKKKVVERGSIFNFRAACLHPYTTSAVTFSSTSVGFGSGSELEWKLMIIVGVH